MSVTNDLDLNTFIHSRSEYIADEVLVHPWGKFAHPVICQSWQIMAITRRDLPEGLTGGLILERRSDVAGSLSVRWSHGKTGRGDTRSPLRCRVTLGTRTV